MKKRCSNYVGATCINGTCPMACSEEYAEACMSVIKNCTDCFYYGGCTDCALSGTAYCTK